MPTITKVTAGDLITAELMNEFLDRLAALEGRLADTAGKVSVPNFVGQVLSAANAALTASTSQLAVGRIIDASGNVVNLDPRNPFVINQVPAGGMTAAAGSAVNLVVSAIPLTITSIAPATQGVNKDITINGTGFTPNATIVELSLHSDFSTLQPEQISGASAARAASPLIFEQQATARTTADLTAVSAARTAAVQPAAAAQTPALALPADGSILQSSEIFRVTRNWVQATPKSVTQTQLQVTVPSNLGQVASGSPVDVRVRIQGTELVTSLVTITVTA